jgi:DNA-binding HxlR family transcriptional regulator
LKSWFRISISSRPGYALSVAGEIHNRWCPLSMALDLLGDPWMLLIVQPLLKGPTTRRALDVFLTGSEANDVQIRIERLVEAGVVRASASATEEGEATFELTDLGRALASTIEELSRWGMQALYTSDGALDPEDRRFDQRWAVGDGQGLRDETYCWTVDGHTFGLEVKGTDLIRTIGAPANPIVSLETSRDVMDKILFGGTSMASAIMRGDLVLSGPSDAIKRMFRIVGFPVETSGYESST